MFTSLMKPLKRSSPKNSSWVSGQDRKKKTARLRNQTDCRIWRVQPVHKLGKKTNIDYYLRQWTVRVLEIVIFDMTTKHLILSDAKTATRGCYLLNLFCISRFLKNTPTSSSSLFLPSLTCTQLGYPTSNRSSSVRHDALVICSVNGTIKTSLTKRRKIQRTIG